MELNWFSVLLGWLGGIPSGLVAQWLYHKLSRKRLAGHDYFTATCSGGSIDFEGRVKTHITAEKILESVLESTKRERVHEEEVTHSGAGGDSY